MAIKKTKNKKSFFIYNIKTLDDKRERHLKEGKFGLKASFKKKKKVLSIRRYKLYVSQKEKLVSGI